MDGNSVCKRVHIKQTQVSDSVAMSGDDDVDDVAETVCWSKLVDG